MQDQTKTTERLESLDVLRGLDLFLLVCFQPLLGQWMQTLAPDNKLRQVGETLFSHVEWEGLHLWDMIMPLFLFMAGAAIPFAYAKYKAGLTSTSTMLVRIGKRVVLLFILGAICQGNLLSLNINSLHIYTNTLQAIAMGYMFSALLYMFGGCRGVIVAVILLPILYTTGMLLYGAGYEPGTNLSEVIDSNILGRFRDGASLNEEGVVQFASWYHYTWIYSTLNFTTTVATGLLSGALLKTGLAPAQKFARLLLFGIGCLLLAWVITFVEPINKHLWTSSMTFLTSGISILLLGGCYYIVDGLKWHRGWMWLKFYGMNSILAYMLYETLEISSLTHFWLRGFEQYMGPYYPTLVIGAKVTLIFFILRFCYKRSIYLRA